ncbi:hypothetical protein HJG60_009455 [Phyllostomus discolor]|uniref:Uncharacterized protein n=1 Tax=Phyllostomus discolor TaxID=89673 RepID=A0A833YBZ5_9CHIR|nr:hypothetical protein HJG60_009455 [Phyllostomus discolor]
MDCLPEGEGRTQARSPEVRGCEAARLRGPGLGADGAGCRAAVSPGWWASGSQLSGCRGTPERDGAPGLSGSQLTGCRGTPERDRAGLSLANETAALRKRTDFLPRGSHGAAGARGHTVLPMPGSALSLRGPSWAEATPHSQQRRDRPSACRLRGALSGRRVPRQRPAEHSDTQETQGSSLCGGDPGLGSEPSERVAPLVGAGRWCGAASGTQRVAEGTRPLRAPGSPSATEVVSAEHAAFPSAPFPVLPPPATPHGPPTGLLRGLGSHTAWARFLVENRPVRKASVESASPQPCTSTRRVTHVPPPPPVWAPATGPGRTTSSSTPELGCLNGTPGTAPGRAKGPRPVVPTSPCS